MKIALLLLGALISFSQFAGAQLPGKPKKIRSSEPYLHKEGGIIFPMNIGPYKRTSIEALSKEKNNIVAEYGREQDNEITKISVYVYPAGEATGERLRSAFVYGIRASEVIAGKTLKPLNSYCFYQKNGYKVNGYKAFYNDGYNNTLELYECGEWFFKVRITSNALYPSQLDSLSKSIVELFSPTDLVRTSPLSLSQSVTINPALQNDEVMMAFMIHCSLTQGIWVQQHVDSMEKISGFPGLYLDMHMEALTQAVGFIDSSKKIRLTSEFNSYLSQLRSLIASGYLDEYIMEYYGMVMIVPDKKAFDFIGYNRWKSSHPITLPLTDRYYKITYKPLNNNIE